MRINNLELGNYRCFQNLEIDFGKITLLTGANSSGKSSVIGSILSIFQTEFFPFYLSTNGDYTELGGYEDIVFAHNQANEITISAKFENHSKSDLDNHIIFTPFEFSSTWNLNKTNGLPTLKGLRLNAESHIKAFGEITKSDKFYLTISKTRGVLSSDIFNNWNRFISELKNIESIKNAELLEVGEENILISKIPFNSLDEMYEKIFFNSKSEILRTYAEDINSIFKTFDKSFNYIHSYRIEPKRSYNQVSKAKNKVEPNGYGYIDQIVEWKETNSEKWNTLISELNKLNILEDISACFIKNKK